MKNNSFSYLFILYQLFKMILRVDSNVNFEIRIQICSTPNSNSNTILNVSTIRYANTEIPYNYLENHPRNQIRIQTILKSIDKFARWRIISPSTFLESSHYPTLNDLHALFNPRLFVHSRDFSSPIVDAFPCQPIQTDSHDPLVYRSNELKKGTRTFTKDRNLHVNNPRRIQTITGKDTKLYPIQFYLCLRR